ncbi:formylglycine-generating enzyme family protein, partial [Corallococcus sp. CA054B]
MKKRKGMEPPPADEPGQGDLFGTSLLPPLRPAPAKAASGGKPPAAPPTA